MAAVIHQGSVFDVLPTLAPGSVDCVVTSPPYWMLRSYLPKGHALKQYELGSEPTPAAFVANMVKVFGLVRDCLADHGTVWLNIGDSYSQSGMGGNPAESIFRKQATNAGSLINGRKPPPGLEGLNLCLIPQRLAIALQDDGWLVRSVIVWHKPAPMPASLSGWRWQRCRVKVDHVNGRQVKAGALGQRAAASMKDTRSAAGVALSAEDRPQWSDCPGCDKCTPHGGYRLRRGSWRPTSSWEPVLMLAKSSGYFCDGEAVKQSAAAATVSRDLYTRVLDDPDEQFAVKHDHETNATAGANLRDVWTIAAEPLREKHYAAFPTELVHRCLKAGTSAKGYCPHCGKPWCRVIEAKFYGSAVNHDDDAEVGKHEWRGTSKVDYEAPKTLDWRPSCSCPPHEPRPGVVLDPFSGSGRTGIEALRLGLDYVGVELNPEYVAMSRRLLRNESPLFSGVE